MKLVSFLLLCSSLSVYSMDLKILAWYRLNPDSDRDRTAEVCFKVTPAPKEPLFVNIVVDKDRRTEGYYSAWVGTKGSLCQVVATVRGLVEVQIPKKNLLASKQY